MKYLDEVSSDRDFKLKIFSLFKKEIIIIEEKMLEALQNNDFENLADLAHKAKSSVSILGMTTVSTEMKQLEIDIKNGKNASTYEKRVKDFIQICHEAGEEIKMIEKIL